MSSVRGPNSALTEFLRERGIDAAHIRARAQARAVEAATEAAGQQTDNDNGVHPPINTRRRTSTTQVIAESSREAAAQSKKGKGKRAAKKRKKGDSDCEDDHDWNSYSKSIPAPGQIAFCAGCDARFTVTAYSRASQDGEGLLCNPCGKETAKDDQKLKRKRTVGKRAKREAMCKALDGQAHGPLTLKEYCIKLVAKYIDDVEALGYLPASDMDRICQIISRNRSLTNATLGLFLDPERTSDDKLTLYDCARIGQNELRNIAAFLPKLKHLSLYHVGQMTDDVLSYYTEKLMQLESLHIRGAFLVTRQAYIDAFAAAGHRLRSLTLSSTARTNQDVIKAIVKHCPNLEYLDVSSLARFDDDCLRLLGGCQHLKGLNVSFAGEKITDDALVEVLDVIGSGLKELNVAGNPLLGPATTAAIHACCSHLRVLDLSECQLLTDSDIVNLFTNWSRNSGLQELHLARLIEMQNSGLIAAVTHSGQTLRVLDINSCLAVNKRGLMTALDQCKKLKKFDVAFVREVDDEVVEKMQDVGIQGLAVWGCTRVTACCKVGAGVTLAGLEADIVA